jgi:hypothetical protein
MYSLPFSDSFANTNMRQANARRKRLCVRVRFRSTQWPLRAQNFAAFGASAFENIAAVRRLHAFTEAMYLAPLTLFGLIGPKHRFHLVSY